MTAIPARIQPALRTAAVLLFALAASSAAPGCGVGNTKLYDVWKDPTSPPRPLEKVLVIAAKRSPASRRIWEDNFATALREHGATAVPSYLTWGDALPDTQSVVDLVRQEKYDGVLVVSRAQIDTVAEQKGGTYNTTPVTYRDPWTGFYKTVYKEVYEPGYTEDVRVVTQEINLWNTKDPGHLVWSASAETYDAQTSEHTSHEVIHEVAKQLADGGLLAKKR